jgi:protocatechuate 3,4-dioxygenase beta subunit
VVLLPGGAEPAPHVEVLAHGGEPGVDGALVRTDGEGRFRFLDLAEGRYVLHLDPEGYLPHQHEVLPGTFDDDVRIELEPASGLRGIITDRAGKPLRAFDLQLRGSTKRGNIGESVGASHRVRDPDGRFEIGDLTPGWYMLEIWARGHAVTLSEPTMVRSNGRFTEISVAMQPAAGLRGIVTDDLGAPIAGASVSLHSNNAPTFGFLRTSAARGSWHATTRTGSDGTFALTEVTARTYQIEVDHPRYPVLHTNDVFVVAGEETELPAIVLDRPAVLKGTVIDGQGNTLRGVKVTLGGGSNRATREVITDSEGRYRFERLASGAYQVHAYAPSAGAMDVLMSTIQRIKRDPDGNPVIPVDVELEPGEEREFLITAQG